MEQARMKTSWMEKGMVTLEFKWSISRAQDTYGYPICSLFVGGKKVSSTCGGGYDMPGTVLGNYVGQTFATQLAKKVKVGMAGLVFIDPDFYKDQEVESGLSGSTHPGVAQTNAMEMDGINPQVKRKYGIPCANGLHTVPKIDGSCGFTAVKEILFLLGYCVVFVRGSANVSTYILQEINH